MTRLFTTFNNNIVTAVFYLAVFTAKTTYAWTSDENYGRYVGRLTGVAHGVRGNVYAVDENTLYVRSFHYDGIGPTAYFWAGKTSRPSPDGFIIPYPEDYPAVEPPPLQTHNNSNIILRLPPNKRIKDIKWLSVWCRRFTVNFGEVYIPSTLDPPKIRVLPEFKRFAHSLRSGNITILDARTFYIPNLHYDGLGPDAYFFVGNGSEPSPYGIKVPNEIGSLEPLKAYQGQDIEIQLPGSLTVHAIDWLAVWCVQYTHNFGHVNIPDDLDVPPALGQTKLTPSWWYNPTSSTTSDPESHWEMNNCRELLPGRLQVQWEIQGDWIQVQLTARIHEDQFIAFGLSGDPNSNSMIGSDVVIVYYDKSKNSFHAEDYYITSMVECDGNNGLCPDERLGGRNDAVLITGTRRNDVTCIVYRRPLQTNEAINDQSVPLDSASLVIAAIGSLGKSGQPSARFLKDTTSDVIRIDFNSKDDHSCLTSLFNNVDDELSLSPWAPNVIIGENKFTARLGPSGGVRGYMGITGIPTGEVVWYINDKLIPEIYVERKQTYTFYIEGGDNPNKVGHYHPFYITDSHEGGFGQKDDLEQKKQRVFAGINYDSEGYPLASAAGRYCEWKFKSYDRSSEMETFNAFFDSLKLSCEDGSAAELNWTVAQETPDIVYYQSYSQSNIGWKIHVVDAGHKWKDEKDDAIKLNTIITNNIPLTCIFVLVQIFMLNLL
ncbi:protein Skeletor, isoforms B/C-like [Daktulosphaira vitifoliae]|uniref:protein Skeletor, isoforms B/C-like n=1 Tax=Daktulosphaira vitifoliae TaxID=58002 RepID=UPI0021AA3362|nr:protein Skeletor, isoforms B/C-like [Daktulosphaira vitifoliae]